MTITGSLHYAICFPGIAVALAAVSLMTLALGMNRIPPSGRVMIALGIVMMTDGILVILWLASMLLMITLAPMLVIGVIMCNSESLMGREMAIRYALML